MTALLTGLASLLVFGGVILVHELGHFMAARHCGIIVEEFSIGFGPCLWSTKKKRNDLFYPSAAVGRLQSVQPPA